MREKENQMNRRVESITYRWGLAALAGMVALAIGISGSGQSAGAATGVPKTVITQGVSGAPGSDAAALDAQNRATAASVGGVYNASEPGGQSSAPDASCPITPCFTDVPQGNPFAGYIDRIYQEDLVSGYACGGVGEPCDSENRPYYRVGASVTRGQMAKFVDGARHLAGINIGSGYNPIQAISNVANGVGVLGYATAGDAVALAGFGDADGTSRDLEGLNAGLYARGRSANNSVGAVLQGNTDNGFWAAANDSSHSAGYFAQEKGGFSVGTSGDYPLNDSYVNGDLIVGGNCTGCVLASIMQNTGTSDIHPGEVASMSAAVNSPDAMNGVPMVGVDRAQGAYSTAVVGVVAEKWMLPDPNAQEGTRERNGYSDASATVIRPGEYMTVATSGAFKTVNVSTVNGPIHVGDLLVASDTAGVAMKADAKQTGFGSVIGKAMGNIESGDGVIAVMLSLK